MQESVLGYRGRHNSPLDCVDMRLVVVFETKAELSCTSIMLSFIKNHRSERRELITSWVAKLSLGVLLRIAGRSTAGVLRSTSSGPVDLARDKQHR